MTVPRAPSMEKKGEGGWKEKRTLPPVPWSGSVAFTMNTERPTGVFCKEKIEKKHARLIERCDFFFARGERSQNCFSIFVSTARKDTKFVTLSSLCFLLYFLV